MYSLTKKIIAFVFLLTVSVPVCLSVKFILEQALIEEEADEKMNTVVLQKVSIAKADIVWIKAGKEILLDGKLFDIKYTESNNDIVTFTGFFDTEETEVVEKFKKYTEANDRKNPLSKMAFKFLFCPMYMSPVEVVYGSAWHNIKNQYYSFDEMLPPAPGYTFIHPPQL